MPIHDCSKEYWQHCINCVAGDPEARIEYADFDVYSIPRCAVVHYDDGQSIELQRTAWGWESTNGNILLPRYEERE